MGSKTPEERAEKEVSKRLAESIADRMMDVKKYKAKIKKLEKEIKQIISGELVPDEDDSSSHPFNNFNFNKFKKDIDDLYQQRGGVIFEKKPIRYRKNNYTLIDKPMKVLTNGNK